MQNKNITNQSAIANSTVTNTTSKRKSKKGSNSEYEKMRASICRDFGNRLTELREKHKLTQPEMMRQFDESTPLSSPGYSRWENGTSQPDIAFLKQLHDKWRVDLNWLIAGDEHFVPDLPFEVQEAIRVLDDYKRKCIFRQ